MGKEEDCKDLAEEAMTVMGGVDMLILNAAYSPKPSFMNETDNWVGVVYNWVWVWFILINFSIAGAIFIKKFFFFLVEHEVH